MTKATAPNVRETPGRAHATNSGRPFGDNDISGRATPQRIDRRISKSDSQQQQPGLSFFPSSQTFDTGVVQSLDGIRTLTTRQTTVYNPLI